MGWTAVSVSIGPVELATTAEVGIKSGSTVGITGTQNGVTAPTGVGVENVEGTALTTADAQDFLYHGVGNTPTTPTALTGYGNGTALQTGVPSTTKSAHRAKAKFKWALLWCPTATYTTATTATTTAPAPVASHGMTFATALTGKNFVAGKWAAEVWLTGSGYLKTLTVRLWRRNISTGATAAIGSLVRSGVVTLTATTPVTVTVSGTVSASASFGATTRLFVDVVGVLYAPGTPGHSVNAGTVHLGTGAARMKLVTPGYQTTAAASATWNTTIGGSSVVKSYSALVVIVHSTTTKIPYCVAAWDASLKALHGYAATFVAPFRSLPGATTKKLYQAVVPIGNEPSDNLALKIAWKTATKGTVTVYGLTGDPGLQIRSDGRCFGVGAFPAYTTSTGGGTLIAAPPAGLRILLTSLTIAASKATHIEHVTVAAKVSGATMVFQVPVSTTSGAAVTSVPVNLPEGGQLLDEATALTFGSYTGAVSGVIAATYDVVY